ncbi:MAG: hypothetical protein A3G39_01090 [Deltaproteobacteria bacterium RIFCSPLOWO2_12_FULL_43_16]|nr:MAG: hypothetical protein A2Z89_10315 [Deltaproteobacteria bacterium GWA2_43_19]OGQ10768.1 MAG: hypothetical protein A3D30_10725 [Deltaproteobacteria bacterium RIFCSPHIGHO2_02_FULL_43_33]OGQ59827.1 MAG: hypothetical protein A3G39_01090 [Deltaproteobacteria bacterium RIFCSPLOWO2_12_FULL_43_16]HBR16648.1 hypothetical protein [Deltaproteobacteria bacterium]
MKRFIIIFAFLFLAMPVLAMAEQPPKEVANITQAFIKGGLVIKGEGLPRKDAATPGEKMLTAKRAATVVAQRNMAEVLNGVIVTGQTTVKDMALESDQIRSTVEGMIKGAQIIYDAYDSLTGIAVVYLAIKVDGADGLNGQLLPQILSTLPQPTAPAYAPPAALPVEPLQPYDALILDIKEHAFKPALINRILAQNGEILYDPTKIAQNILVERGAGDYTNDVGKAKALLSERGAKNPLVVKAAGVVKFTDVQVSGDDAANIFTSNQKANFLEGAKVVFVLK